MSVISFLTDKLVLEYIRDLSVTVIGTGLALFGSLAIYNKQKKGYLEEKQFHLQIHLDILEPYFIDVDGQLKNLKYNLDHERVENKEIIKILSILLDEIYKYIEKNIAVEHIPKESYLEIKNLKESTFYLSRRLYFSARDKFSLEGGKSEDQYFYEKVVEAQSLFYKLRENYSEAIKQ
ncbi:hypothetical protein [Virgibacillus halodenitrificans]|uniref:Aromatic acid exporter C-terminal domain-containing protein n=1 Tax=Virgibacillus halodenitrificans TaxID=1482 RepID=A0ABR7VMY6_VIRHA|nr:hypothetical protein [Virgibacillus halodenitrificans]MBD1223274.1 hypothetical protein [Virgibacillus halodenitrificans]